MNVHSMRNILILLTYLACAALVGAEDGSTEIASFDEDVEALAVHSRDYDYLYAVTPGKFHASTDGGASWNTFETPFLLTGDRLLIPDRRDKEAVFLLCGRQTSKFAPGKLFRTADGGKTWTQLAGHLPDLQIASFAQNWRDTETLYLADSGGKIYRSTDGGANWAAIDVVTFAGQRIGTIGAFSSAPKRLLVVAVPWDVPCPCGSVYLSDDGGVTWRKTAPVVDEQGYEKIPAVGSVQYSPREERILWGTEAFLAIYSSDGGKTWTELEEEFDVRTTVRENIVLDPDDPKVVYLFADKVWRGHAGDKKWSAILEPGRPVEFLAIRSRMDGRTILYASGRFLYSAPLPK